MYFKAILLKTNPEFGLTDKEIICIRKWITSFILNQFKELVFDYELNIVLTNEGEFWGKTQFKDNKIEELTLRIILFKDLVYKDINLDEIEAIKINRANTIFHELVHIRNKIEYGLRRKFEVNSISTLKELLVEVLIDEYLAVYESDKRFKVKSEIMTEAIFLEKIEKIMSQEICKAEKSIKISYLIATIIGQQHVEFNENNVNNLPTEERFRVLRSCQGQMKDVYEGALTILSRSLYFYHGRPNISIIKRKLRPSIGYILDMISN
jgi:hypothetical protein